MKKFKQTQELKALARMPDKDIRLESIPEVIDWKNAERAKFYRPRKNAITIRIDSDVLAWFKAHGSGYQGRMNQALRDYAAHHHV